MKPKCPKCNCEDFEIKLANISKVKNAEIPFNFILCRSCHSVLGVLDLCSNEPIGQMVEQIKKDLIDIKNILSNS